MYRIWFEVKFDPIYDELVGEDVKRLGNAPPYASDRFAGIESAQAAIAGGLVYDEAMMSRAPDLLQSPAQASAMTRSIWSMRPGMASPRLIRRMAPPFRPRIYCHLMMGVAKSLPAIQADMRNNLLRQVPRPMYRAIELADLQLGLVGLGRIGGHVAKVALAIGMRVHAYDPWLAPGRMKELGVQPAASLEALLAEADVVSLHLPLNESTRKIMNAERFAQMKSAPSHHAARGGHVDEAALLDALDCGKLFGAAWT